MDERKQRAISLKMSGMTYAEVGKELGISRQRAQQLVRPPSAIYRLVKSRANSMCEECGAVVAKGGVHHLNSSENYNDLENLRYLCLRCHAIAHIPDRKESKSGIEHACQRCGKSWKSLLRNPTRCGKCKSPYWDRPKQ